MFTSDRVFDARFAKQLATLNGFVPAALLTWDAYRNQLGVNHVNFAIRTTGMAGLVLLTLTLAVTPLRRVTGWNVLVAIRRNLGLLGFGYLAAHFALFVVFDRQGSVASTASEIAQRTYLWFGAGALALMMPLAITSTDTMVLRLGAARWKRLQRLAYVVAAGAVAHYYLLVKSDVRLPLVFAVLVGALLGFRAIAHYVDLRASAGAARRRIAAENIAGQRPRSFWSGEMIVARIFDESHDVKTFRLVPTDGGDVPFTHIAGQYVTLALTIDGRRLNRCYTISSPPTRRSYCEISVKRTADGHGSHHMHDVWCEGQRVTLSGPAGRFGFEGHHEARVVLIAGGIGITPMMSVVRTLTDRCWPGEIYLLLSVRSVNDIVFLDELAYLQSRFLNLRVRVVVSADPDTPWDGLRGHITRDTIAAFVPGLTRGPILLCGPPPMMAAMRQTLVDMGIPDADVQQEAFASPARGGPGDRAAALGVNEEPSSDASPAEIVFTRTRESVQPSRGQTVLEAAEEAGVSIPFECRSGVCGQCKTRLISGRVTLDAQEALTIGDRANGLILACQARAIATIEVDA